MGDNRFVRADGEAIKRFRKGKAWSQNKLSEKAKVSLDTIKRAERGERKQLGIMLRIAEALEIKPMEISRDLNIEPGSAMNYTWDDLITGAKKVGDEIFGSKAFCADAILTFPGPSSLFCGLVLAMLPLKALLIPVYTAVFVDAKTSTFGRSSYFHVISMPAYKLLVPRELTADKTKKIAVVDDNVITGGAMEKLRTFFRKNYEPRNVKFACCICYEGRTFPTEVPPEIIGLTRLEQRRKFPMPWGRDSFCFEDIVFETIKSSSKTPSYS